MYGTIKEMDEKFKQKEKSTKVLVGFISFYNEKIQTKKK
jgi:hypothetical protein